MENTNREDMAKVIAKLFDTDSVAVKESRDDDYDVFSGDSDGKTFEQKVKDMQLVTSDETKDDIEKMDELEESKKIDEPKVEHLVDKPSSDKAYGPTEADYACCVRCGKRKFIYDLEDGKCDNCIKKEFVPEDKDILTQAEEDKSFSVNKDNPLDLIGKDLERYKYLFEKYPIFSLSDENTLMRPFYKTKVEQLYYVLTNYPLLNIKSINNEIKEVKLNYSIRGIPHGDIIAQKLDEVIRQRERISEILISIHQQFVVWKSALEIMRGKLWYVKDVKGQHKREGITADHLADVVWYVSSLEAALDAAKYLDGVLVSNGDCLSRQLACIQEKRIHDTVSIAEDNEPVRSGFNKTGQVPSHGVRDIGNVFVDSEDELSAIG